MPEVKIEGEEKTAKETEEIKEEAETEAEAAAGEAETEEETEEATEEAAEAEDAKEVPEGESEEPKEEASEEAEQEESAGEKKKGFFKKKEKKDKKDEKIEELTDRVKRQMAEFENFRKRTEKEKASMYEMGAKSVVEKILPVIDHFERGLDTVPEEEADAPFTEGMRKIYKQLLSELEQIVVTPIECVGKEFDPNLHNAVMQVESE
ncbi:MAG: nucleotide exchange factor GrpE, partial [Lachnospiraceae bacterium]|nr:nucleotide exchange factor GrpE [Lachnospiraceae bacterium]